MMTGKMSIRLLAAALAATLLSSSVPALAAAGRWQWTTPQTVGSRMAEGSGLWLVDVRGEAEFASIHPEGAVNIPASLLGTRTLPKGKTIVIVDDSLGLKRGREAADLLVAKGCEKVFVLEGGLPVWQKAGKPLAGKNPAPQFRRVTPEELAWAQERKVPLRVFDLREKREAEHAPVAAAVRLEGKDLEERLVKARSAMLEGEKKGLAAGLEPPAVSVLVFPVAADPALVLQRMMAGVSADIRYLEGGLLVWAARADKEKVGTGATCPTCGKSGGSK